MAQEDLFGNEVNYSANSIITAHNMLLTVEGQSITTIGALVQNVTIQYSQPIQIIREVGSKNYYYFAQPPQGSVSFGRLVAQDKTILDILPKSTKNIWEVPKEGQQSPQINLKSVDNDNVKYELYQCIVESLGINTDVNAAFVQEQIVVRFGSMQIKTTGALPTGNLSAS